MAKTPITTVDEALGRLREHFTETMLDHMNARRAQREVRTRVLTCAEMIPRLSERAWTLGQHLEAAELLEKLTASSRQISSWIVTPRHKCQHHREQILIALDWLCRRLLERIENEERLDSIQFAQLSAKPFDQWTTADDTQFERLTLRVIDDGGGEFRTEEASNPNRLALYLARADYLKQQLQEESNSVSNNNDPQDPKDPTNPDPNKTIVAGSRGGVNDNAPLNSDGERVAELLSPNHWAEKDFIDAVRIGGLQGPNGGYQAGSNIQLWLRFVGEYTLHHNHEPLSAADANQAKGLEAFPLASWERAHVDRARKIGVAKHVRDDGFEVRAGFGKLNSLANAAERRLNNLEEAAKLAAKPVPNWVFPDDYRVAYDLCLVDESANPLVIQPGFEPCWKRCQEALAARDADLRAQTDEVSTPFLSTKVLERHIGVKDPLGEKNRAPQHKLATAAYNRWKAELLAGASAPMTAEQAAWAQDPNVLATLGPKIKTELIKRLAQRTGNVVVVTATNRPSPTPTTEAPEPDPRPSDGAKQMAQLVQKPSMRDLLRQSVRYIGLVIAAVAGVLLAIHLMSGGGAKTVTNESILSSVDGGAVMEPTPPPVTTEVPTEVQPSAPAPQPAPPSEEPPAPPAPPSPTAPAPVTSADLGGQPLSNVDWRRVPNFFPRIHCTSTMTELPSGNYDLRGHHCTWTP